MGKRKLSKEECAEACFNIKQPIGLKPKWVHDFHRSIDIIDAIHRYVSAGLIPPIEWVEELADSIKRDEGYENC